MARVWIKSVPLIAAVIGSVCAQAQEVDKSRIPPAAVYQSMLDANKSTGWVQFRNFNGQQLIYYTSLPTERNTVFNQFGRS